jgi:hypothetical protein
MASDYEYCDCYEQGIIKTHVMCGCDVDHVLWPMRSEIIHWRGGHWSLLCAFRQMLNESRSTVAIPKPLYDAIVVSLEETLECWGVFMEDHIGITLEKLKQLGADRETA